MKTIVTTEEGAEAAKAVYSGTSEVTEVDSRGLACLLVSLSEEPDSWNLPAWRSYVEDLQKRVGPDERGRVAPVLLLYPGQSLSALDEKAMRRLGWRRV